MSNDPNDPKSPPSDPPKKKPVGFKRMDGSTVGRSAEQVEKDRRDRVARSLGTIRNVEIECLFPMEPSLVRPALAEKAANLGKNPRMPKVYDGSCVKRRLL